jgi:acetolactate synthase-1/2/3 large subunit
MQSGGRIQHVLMRDERSAGFAADAYARVSGQTGVCDATVGPGATNLVSPLAEAFAASIPILAIISDIPRSWEHRRIRGNASQAMNQIDLFRPISKWQTTLTDPQAVDDVVDAAFRIATTGRPGPVVISIPDDVFNSSAPENEASERARTALFPKHRTISDPELLRQAVELMRKARKPVLFVGGGALISSAFQEVRRLAEKLTTRVATTLTGKGILEDDHPLSVGVAGSMGRPIANEIIQEGDLVIFIGTKAGQIATFTWDFPKPGIPIVHIDVDPEEIGRNFADSMPLVGDARLTLAELNNILGDDLLKTDWDSEEISQRVQTWYEEAVDKSQGQGEPLKPQAVMKTVNRFVNPDDLIVCDASLSAGWAAVYLNLTKAGRRYFAPRGLAGLGWGAPAAIGASLATDRNQRILHFAGDGGFAYSVQELEVMARLNLPVISILFNNDTLAWIKHVEKHRFKNEYISTDFQHVDFATVAEGFGLRSYRVRDTDELVAALEREKSAEGPSVIDMITDQWETPVLRFSSGE